jgi:isoleucyl-tRNA synthetase
MQNWLDSMEDWMISRKRFYGLALPFYQCSCGKLSVVSSLEELRSLAINPELVNGLKSIHRPWIDNIEITCPKCNKIVKRIPDIGDVWLDAGIVPFSTLKYLTDKAYWQKWFPADLVLEMTEQIRLWFYSMLFMSVTLENTSPYRHVVVHAEVRDERGDRMSKTKKNGIPYEDAISKMGADSMRWLYCQQKAHTAVNFGFNIADQVKRDFILILWNSYRFFTQHANLENWQPNSDVIANEAKQSQILDHWILSRLNSTLEKTTKALDKFSTPIATIAIESFVSDLSTWYIRRSRDRADNFSLLYQVFNTVVVTIAPFIPFFAETIYQNLNPNKNESVHLQSWPKANVSAINPELEKQMELVRQICQLIHGQRQSAGIKVRQPLSCATVTSKHQLQPELIAIICQETNVKSINLVKNQSSSIAVSLDITITPALKEEGDFRDFVRQIQVLRKESGLSPIDKISILAPNWPKNFETDILKKTQANSITQNSTLQIKKIG